MWKYIRNPIISAEISERISFPEISAKMSTENCRNFSRNKGISPENSTENSVEFSA